MNVFVLNELQGKTRSSAGFQSVPGAAPAAARPDTPCPLEVPAGQAVRRSEDRSLAILALHYLRGRCFVTCSYVTHRFLIFTIDIIYADTD